MGIAIIIVLLLAALFGPSLWVRRVLAQYGEPADRYPGTGAELARYLLDHEGLQSVRVEQTAEGDHYDPREKVVRLSAANFDSRSLTAITVAAHEVGHALQDRDRYTPLHLRTRLVVAAQRLEPVAAAVLIGAPLLGAVTRVPSLGLLALLTGVVAMGTSTVVHLVTLPTEFNASFGRALPLLQQRRILRRGDLPHARRLLLAAALTYVSASLAALLNIARWIAILRR